MASSRYVPEAVAARREVIAELVGKDVDRELVALATASSPYTGAPRICRQALRPTRSPCPEDSRGRYFARPRSNKPQNHPAFWAFQRRSLFDSMSAHVRVDSSFCVDACRPVRPELVLMRPSCRPVSFRDDAFGCTVVAPRS